MVWDPPEKKSLRWHGPAIGIICIWITTNIFRFSLYDRDTQQFDQILSVMKPEKMALSMMVETKSPYFLYPIYLHFPLWYQATRNGIVDLNFGAFYVVPVQYKSDARPNKYDKEKWPQNVAGSGWPTKFSWDKHNGAFYDYFVVRASKDMSKDLFKDKRDAVSLKARKDWWWLYEKKR